MTEKRFVFVCCPAITGLRLNFPYIHLSLRARLNEPAGESDAILSLVGDQYTCSPTFTFEHVDPNASFLCFHVREPQSGADQALVTLPIVWFTPNSVVKYPFPMRTVINPGQTFFHAEVHRCENGGAAFDAPPGHLTVIPNWSVPVQSPPGPDSAIWRTGRCLPASILDATSTASNRDSAASISPAAVCEPRPWGSAIVLYSPPQFVL
jgi:hypothetical protein